MINLDTHILVFAFSDNLFPVEKTLLASKKWSISAMVFWEIAKLRQRHRIEFDFKDPTISAALKRIKIWPPWIRRSPSPRHAWISHPTRRTNSSPPPASFTAFPCLPVIASSDVRKSSRLRSEPLGGERRDRRPGGGRPLPHPRPHAGLRRRRRNSCWPACCARTDSPTPPTAWAAAGDSRPRPGGCATSRFRAAKCGQRPRTRVRPRGPA